MLFSCRFGFFRFSFFCYASNGNDKTLWIYLHQCKQKAKKEKFPKAKEKQMQINRRHEVNRAKGLDFCIVSNLWHSIIINNLKVVGQVCSKSNEKSIFHRYKMMHFVFCFKHCRHVIPWILFSVQKKSNQNFFNICLQFRIYIQIFFALSFTLYRKNWVESIVKFLFSLNWYKSHRIASYPSYMSQISRLKMVFKQELNTICVMQIVNRIMTYLEEFERKR